MYRRQHTLVSTKAGASLLEVPLALKGGFITMTERTKFSMQWHITDRCDQRCKHCYIYEGKDKKCGLELDLDTLKAILEDFLRSCDALERDPFLVITGGDPLLYERIWDFLEILKEKKVHFGLLGNPFHLDYEVVKKLEDLGCINFQMSLDGLKETHDYIQKQILQRFQNW